MLSADSERVTALAREIIEVQSSVPRSPAALDKDGIVQLCFAAAVLKAGLLAEGRLAEADALNEELIGSSSKACLLEAFERFGWSQRECKWRLEFNDSCDDSERKANVLARLDYRQSA